MYSSALAAHGTSSIQNPVFFKKPNSACMRACVRACKRTAVPERISYIFTDVLADRELSQFLAPRLSLLMSFICSLYPSGLPLSRSFPIYSSLSDPLETTTRLSLPSYQSLFISLIYRIGSGQGTGATKLKTILQKTAQDELLLWGLAS